MKQRLRLLNSYLVFLLNKLAPLKHFIHGSLEKHLNRVLLYLFYRKDITCKIKNNIKKLIVIWGRVVPLYY
jgi:hypothetical protein